MAVAAELPGIMVGLVLVTNKARVAVGDLPFVLLMACDADGRSVGSIGVCTFLLDVLVARDANIGRINIRVRLVALAALELHWRVANAT